MKVKVLRLYQGWRHPTPIPTGEHELDDGLAEYLIEIGLAERVVEKAEKPKPKRRQKKT